MELIAIGIVAAAMLLVINWDKLTGKERRAGSTEEEPVPLPAPEPTVAQARKQFREKLRHYMEASGKTGAAVSRSVGRHLGYVGDVLAARMFPTEDKAVELMYEVGFTEEEVSYFEKHLYKKENK